MGLIPAADVDFLPIQKLFKRNGNSFGEKRERHGDKGITVINIASEMFSNVATAYFLNFGPLQYCRNVARAFIDIQSIKSLK